MSDLNVLVVGASIAGPMTAYWFARAGANVTVIERFPELRIGGQSIDIRNAGVTVMRKIPGMEEEVRAKTTTIEGFSWVRDDDQPIAAMRPTGDVNAQSLVSEFEIFRGDLSRILYNRTRHNDKVKYVFGEQIASMQHKDKDGPITVEFMNGHPTAQYDLVVACDGATSRTRALGFECGVRDHITNINFWAAYFSIKQDLLQGSKMGRCHNSVPGRFLAIGPDPSGVTRVMIGGMYPRSQPDATQPFRKAAQQGDDVLKQYIARAYDGVGWKAQDIIKGMMDTDDFYASELVSVKVPSLYKGRLVLVGDAGYASSLTGSGTSQAIAGAYILAGEVCKHKGDLSTALEAYNERMKPLIADGHSVPPGFPGVLAPQTAWGLWFRNVVLVCICSAMAYGKYISWMGRFFSSAFGGDTYKLPDYEWVA